MDLPDLSSVRSKEALRFEFVAEQATDTSCGYAALATLLTSFWNIPVTEGQLLEGTGGQDNTVSLAVLAQRCQDRGLSTKAYAMTWGQLALALDRFSPILVHYDRPDPHFALALGIRNGWLVAIDPARGTELLSQDEFLSRWSGAVLLVASQGRKADGLQVSRVVEAVGGKQELLERWAR